MNATSPYAPPRRQSSTLSTSSTTANPNRMLRRSSSNAIVSNLSNTAGSGATAALFWLFLRFWKRVFSRSDDDDDRSMSEGNTYPHSGISRIRDALDGFAEMVSSHLSVVDGAKDQHKRDSIFGNISCASNENGSIITTKNPLRRRGISAILRWVVAIVGGSRSRLGQVIVKLVGFTREVILRSIFATNVIVSGVPSIAPIENANEVGLVHREDEIEDHSLPALEVPIISQTAKLVHNEMPVSNDVPMQLSKSDLNVDLIKQDRQQIDQVLNYWFGQASPDGAQKSLWMIASSSHELQHRVDAEIADKFRILIWDLFSGFSEDCAISCICGKSSGGCGKCSKCGSVVDGDCEKWDWDIIISNSDKTKIHRWTEETELFGWQGKIAAIIALDQMSRHIHRHDLNTQASVHQNKHSNTLSLTKESKHGIQSSLYIPKQKRLDKIAYEISLKLQNHHRQEITTGMIPIPMRIFGIMPLRHASTCDDLGVVQNDVESASSLHEEIDRMIRRFRKATNRRMGVLQDEARREGKLGLPEESGESDVEIVSKSSGEEKCNGTHKKSLNFDDEQILESFPFDADMTQAHNHIVTKTIRSFLQKVNILQTNDKQSNSKKTASSSFQSNIPPQPQSIPLRVPVAIVSLSGGVDSMVIASALAFLRDTEARERNATPDEVLRIVAIHIDYANRPESAAEAAYVERYSRQIGARFVCRRIGEVTRGVTARDDYERIAREIRFGLYRQCCKEANGGEAVVNGGELHETGIGVMLGHHRGDLRENVISNAHKGCGPLDLSGMTSISKNDGVTLFRPLLPLEKTSIFDYAHTFGVPYFKDTTPHWSTRGKLRNKLLPLLEEIYGEGSMDNLSSLAEESDDARALLQQTVISPFMDWVKHWPMGISFETGPWKDCGLFFWKFVLRDALHSAGRGMFSDKSVESFIDRIRPDNLREGWLQCRKDYAVYLRKNGSVFVFHPNSFPFRKNDMFEKPSARVNFGKQNSTTIGPWNVWAEEIFTTSEDDANCKLQQKSYETMEQLMSGEISYYVRIPFSRGVACPLVFVSGFTKKSRPAAWKGTNLKIESTLPLLGVDESSQEEGTVFEGQEYGKNWTVVKVSLSLQHTHLESS